MNQRAQELQLELEPDATREQAVQGLGLVSIPCLVEPLSQLEQIAGEVRAVEVDAEALDDAASFDDCASGFPEGAALTGTRLVDALRGEAKRAGGRLLCVHGGSVRGRRIVFIGAGGYRRCGLLRNVRGRLSPPSHAVAGRPSLSGW